MSIQPSNDNVQPPAYDTISLSPPSADAEQSSSSAQSRAVNTPDGSPQQHQQTKKSLKDRWREMKEEDERRKAGRIQHVSREEADRITGLDRHREAEAKKNNAERPRGIKSVLGVLMLN